MKVLIGACPWNVRCVTGGEVDEEENEEGAYVDEAGDEDLDEEVSEGKQQLVATSS